MASPYVSRPSLFALRGDHTIWLVYFFLAFISFVEVSSAMSYLVFKATNYMSPILNHIGFFAIGIMVTFVVSRGKLGFFSRRYLLWCGWVLTVGLLALAILKGHSQAGANRAIFGFQPIEGIKISSVVLCSFLLGYSQSEDGPREGVTQVLVVLGVSVLMVAMENMSSALIIGFVIFALMVVSKVSWKILGSIVGVGVLFLSIWLLLGATVPQNKLPGFLHRAPTHWSRVERMIHSTAAAEDEDDPVVGQGKDSTAVRRHHASVPKAITDENRQVVNSQVAIANGRIYPRMPGCSIQRDYLPEAYSDFVFAIIVEELGLVGGGFVMLLYLTLLFRAGILASRAERTYPALLIIGIALLIVSQAAVHIATTTNFMGLVTGQPLPLISKGGSSVLCTSLAIGLMLCASADGSEKKKN